MILEVENICDSSIKCLSVQRLQNRQLQGFCLRQYEKMAASQRRNSTNPSSYSPESNEKAERLNRTSLDIARTMMQDINHALGRRRLWAEAISTANFIRNRLFSTACNDPTKAPLEVITGKRPNVHILRRFGSKAFICVPKAKRKGKLETRAEVGYLVGFQNGNSCKVYLPHKKTVIISRDFKFEGLCQQNLTPSRESASANLEPQSVSFSLSKENAVTDPSAERDIFSCVLDLKNITHYPSKYRSERTVLQQDRYTDTSAMIALNVRMGNEDSNVSTSYKEAMSGPNRAA